MYRHLFQAAIAAFMAAVATTFIVATGSIRSLWNEPMGPAAYPRSASILLLVFSVAVMGTSVAAHLRDKRGGVGRVPSPPADAEPDQAPDTQAAVAWLVLAVFLYGLTAFLLDYFVATFAFLFLASVALGSQSARKTDAAGILSALAVAALVTAAIYGAVAGLRIYVPAGGWLS